MADATTRPRDAVETDNARIAALGAELARVTAERDAARAVLDEERAWFDHVLDRLPVAVTVVEKERGVTYRNALARTISGRDALAPVTADVYADIECFDSAGRLVPTSELPAMRIARGEELHDEIMTSRVGDGWRSVRIDSANLPPVGSHPACAVMTYQDVSRLVEAERAQRESERLFRTMSESVPQLVWMTRPDGFSDYFNQRWYDYTGVPVGRSEGDGWMEVVHPDDRAAAAAAWTRAHTTGGRYEAEYRMRGRDGVFRWFLARGNAVRDSSGAVVRWFGTCTDVDEQRRAIDVQRFLAEAGEVLTGSVDYEETLANVARLAVPRVADWCGVDVVQPDGGFKRLATAHKDPDKVALAHELNERFPTDPNAPTGTPNVLRTGKTEWIPAISDELLVAVVPDPELLAIIRELGLASSMCVPMRVHDRTIGTISFVNSESTHRFSESDVGIAEELARRAAIAVDNARLYRELRALNSTLEKRVVERTTDLTEANRELESFSYTVSHDLRAPVRHIAGFLDLLERHAGTKLDEKSQHYVRTIGAAARQMGALIDALLAFSRMGRVEFTRGRVGLAAIVQDVIESSAPDLRDRTVEWSVATLPDVRGDAALLRLVFANLVGNAIKYTRGRTPAHIAIECAPDTDGYVTVTVRDDGVGFDMAYVNKLFGVFQRLHGANEFEGTGIGLATVRRVVQRHGGRAWAEGRDGEGASFHVTLPLAERGNG